ncbi:MAG: hypothetical protein JO329_18510 [Planctomycetaceae bacterium]|nr:hypothetical protein [Planctomycetaceae bacterium]
MVRIAARRMGFNSLAAVLAGLVLACASGRAQAQWGWGWGWGWGTFGFQPSPATTFVNERALINAQNIQRPSSLRAPQSTTRYRGRDPEFFERYDIETRRALEDRVARRSSRSQPGSSRSSSAASPAPPAARPTQAVPSLPLGSFFSPSDELVWPADAPVGGDLGAKRATADRASLAVLREQRAQGRAQLTTVATARDALLEYGRPALQFVRAHATAHIADSFHWFLLSLYETLAQAADPPRS